MKQQHIFAASTPPHKLGFLLELFHGIRSGPTTPWPIVSGLTPQGSSNFQEMGFLVFSFL
jgi:hypothetical protein